MFSVFKKLSGIAEYVENTHSLVIVANNGQVATNVWSA